MIDKSIFLQATPVSYADMHDHIKTGDLLFCSGNGLISDIIKDATGSPFSHVGMILRLPVTDQWLVLESVESFGVRCVALEQGYVSNYRDTGKGYDGCMLVARHQDVEKNFKYIESLYQRAFELTGDKYSRADIFQIASRIALNKIGIHEDGLVKDNNRYICSEYVYACLKAMHINLPYNPLGFISPADIASNPKVDAVGQLATTEQAEKVKSYVTN